MTEVTNTQARKRKKTNAKDQRIYADQLQTQLESQHLNRFVAIEPESREYFLGRYVRRGRKVRQIDVPCRLSHTSVDKRRGKANGVNQQSQLYFADTLLAHSNDKRNSFHTI